ncbi:MAG: DUF1161 domain-containing protein [Rhodoferax sp.]|nr:DUF1161 domain-containing protein [Rhodoferax sp.]
MKNLMLAFVLLALVVPAWAKKSCDELKTKIAAKMEARGVRARNSTSWPGEEVKDQKVVGSCEGGTKKITYKKA